MVETEIEPETNLTSGQIQTVMDRLLYKALEPVILYTNLFDSQLIYLLALVTRNKKRKVSSLNRNVVLEILVKALACDNPTDKLELIRKLRLERSFIHVFLKRFVDSKTNFLGLYQAYMVNPSERKRMSAKMQPYINSSGCISKQDYYLAIVLTSSNLELFYTYFDSVVAKYYKLCYSKARSLQEMNPNNNYDYFDIVQNLRRKTVIALNKYDASSGALTAYIKWWMYNSVTSSSSEHEYGLAYTIPQNHKNKMSGANGAMNFSVSMDTSVHDEDGDECSLHNILNAETPELDDEAASEHLLDKLYLIVKAADPLGIARLSMDIPEVFTEDELKFMRDTTLLKL